MRLGEGRSELLLFQGWAPHHPHLHQVLEAQGVGPLRQEAGSLGQWPGWAQGASRRCRKVGSAQWYFLQKGPPAPPPELPGGVGRKHDADSDSSFHNMLGSLSQNHEIERTRKKTMMRKMMTMKKKTRMMRRWLQW